MSEIKELLKICKASVTITVNQHRDYYQSVKEYFEEQSKFHPDLIDEIDKEIYEKMVETDTVVEIQAYPDSPNGFYIVYHHDIDQAIEAMITIIKNQ